MSYLVLARKWRPQTFADVVGQRPVVRTLQNALKRNRVAHAMLFSGVRGVGKTTLARIMAKAINCEGDTETPPCDSCDSCRAIAAGTAVDLHEIDGASNRGIQEIRELKDNIRFFPSRSRYKVIIIDEVHMLTTEAFNALLKTLEEPPAHVYFMFATTELHKIPVTILSRCQRYELTRVPFDELLSFFARIAKEEGVTISEAALQMITGEAEGSVRDGLSLLDQIFSFCGEEVRDEDVRQVLGLLDRHVYEEIAVAMLAGRVAECIELLDRAYAAGLDLKRFSNDLLEYFRALIVCATSKTPEKLLDLPSEEIERLKDLAAARTAESIYNVFNLLLRGIDEMQHSSHPRLVLEMIFIKASQAGQIVSVTTLLERLDHVLQHGGQHPQGGGGAKSEGYRSSAPDKQTVTVREPVPEHYAKKQEAQEPQEKSAVSDATPEDQPETVPAAFTTHKRDVRKSWDDFIAYVKQRKQWMAHVLGLVSGVQQVGEDLVLKFDLASDCKILKEANNVKLLTEFAQDFFQQELKVKLQIPGKHDNGANGEDELTPQEERRILGDDPLVQTATEVFGGQVSGIRTGPRSR